MSIDLDSLTQKEATLVQHGLKALGYYTGTTRGRPGPKTRAALDVYLGPPPTGRTFSEIFASSAERQVGVREVGNNGGLAVTTYQRATNLDPGSWPWCAAFVCWCYARAVDLMGADAGRWPARPTTAGAWTFERWATRTGAKLIKPAIGHEVRRGDIVVYRFSHIGIAVANEKDDRVTIVEGNTNPGGDSEGDGVYRRSRKKSQIRSIIRIT